MTLEPVKGFQLLKPQAMEKYTQKQLRALVKSGAAIDVTNAHDSKAITEPYKQIGYTAGLYGCNGMLLQGMNTGKLYAVTARTSAVYLF